MSYEFCSACHKYREMTRHVCEPEWLVLQDDAEEGVGSEACETSSWS